MKPASAGAIRGGAAWAALDVGTAVWRHRNRLRASETHGTAVREVAWDGGEAVASAAATAGAGAAVGVGLAVAGEQRSRARHFLRARPLPLRPRSSPALPPAGQRRGLYERSVDAQRIAVRTDRKPYPECIPKQTILRPPESA